MITTRIYKTHPFMVSSKTPMKCIENYYRSHKDYTLPYILIKFSYRCSQIIKPCCGQNCLRIAAAELDIHSLIEKKIVRVVTEVAVRKTTGLVKM